MASKSKKRRRVLGASCILAALIIAGSSFAWFTSKDEVTNRLTASNDYGVSIVESFTPPANWLPGQTVNKDVYAVNTGNIAAFVKESISGNLTYTYEKREAKSPKDETDSAELAKYVKLNDTAVRAIDGVTTNEAGGYLAWTDATSTDPNAIITPGPIISATNTDYNESQGETPIDNPGKVEGTPWTPPAAGTYVFRRSYVPGTDAVDNTTYTYKFGDVAVDASSFKEGVYRANNTDDNDAPHTFRYSYTDTTDTYYADSLDNNAKFYKITEAVGVKSYDPTDANTKTLTATPDTTNNVAATSPYYTYAGYYYDGNGNYYKVVLGNDSFRTYKDDNNNDVFDVSATAAQLGDGSTIEIDPLTGAVKNGAIAYQFVKEETIENATPYLTYYAGGPGDGDVAKLVAYYSAGDTDESADFLAKQAAADQAAADAQQAYRDYLDAISDEALAEADYENAVGAYNAAVSRRDQAVADWTYANALSEASKKLVDAAKVRADAQIEWDNANDDLNKAEKAVKLEATHLQGGGSNGASPLDNTDDDNKSQFSDIINLNNATTNSTDISYYTIFKTDWSNNGTLEDVIGHNSPDFDYGNISNSILTSCAAYRSQMEQLWGQAGATGAKGVKATSIVAASDRLKKALQDFANLNRNSATGADNDVKAYLAELYDARQNLEDLLEEYKALYDHLETSAGNETELTHLIQGDDSTMTFGDKIDAWIARVKQMKKAIEENKSDSQIGELDIDPTGNVVTTPEDARSNRFGLDAIVQDFVIKYNNFVQEDMHDLPAAKTAWKEAVKQYNKDVDTTVDSNGAGDKYTKAIHTDQRKRDAVKDDGDDTNIVYTKNDYEGLTSDGTAKLTSTTANDKWWLTDNSKILVGLFAVERPTNSSDPSLASYVDSGTGELTENGEKLWKTIGSDNAMPGETADDALIATGYGNYGFYEADDGDHKTKESVWTDLVATTGNTSENTSSYVKAIIATAKGKNEFTTLVKDQNSPTGTAFNDNNTTNDVPYPTVSALEGRINDLKTAADNKKTVYTTAQATTKQKNADQTAAADVATYAQATADNAADADSSAIKINIYLDDRNDAGHGDLNWTSALGNGESAQVAEFYYNYILNAGETSDKLIDAVELDPSVGTKDYKNLVFDLNVALDSAQITYANDQRTITADAATEESFGKKANIVSQTPDDKGIKVTWTPAASYEAPNKVYRVGLTTVTVDDADPAVVKFTVGTGDDAVNYSFKYKVTVNEVDYYGNSKDDGTTYSALKKTDDNFVGFAEATDLEGKPTTVTLNTVE